MTAVAANGVSLATVMPYALRSWESIVVKSQSAANYATSTNYFETIVPPAGYVVNVKFTAISTEAGFDYVTVFSSTAGPFQATTTAPTANLAATTCSGAAGTACLPCAGTGCSLAAIYTGTYGTAVVVELFSDSSTASTGVTFKASLTACPVGSYCATGTASSASALCAAGYYGATVGQNVSTCSGPCSAGYYGPAGSTSATQVQCPVGSFCAPGSAAAAACPAGWPAGD